MENTISFLYLLNGLVVIIAYVPQAIKLKGIKERPVNFSTATWSLWTYTAIVALSYALFVNKDPNFILVASLNLICVTAILLIILYKTLKYPKLKTIPN
jgi:hypothetical protein